MQRTMHAVLVLAGEELWRARACSGCIRWRLPLLRLLGVPRGRPWLRACAPAGLRFMRSVQSVLDEMAAVLAESGRSMREMSTETKEQQREWWRAR